MRSIARETVLALEDAKDFLLQRWEKENMSPQCQKCAKKKTKCFFPNHEMCHVCAVKMPIAPCEFEMFCPKCGLIKENVFFFFTPLLDKKQKSKRALLAQKGQILFTTYNAKFLILVFINWAGCCGLSRFEWICRFWQKTKYSFYISIIIDFVTFGKTSEQRPQIHKGT